MRNRHSIAFVCALGITAIFGTGCKNLTQLRNSGPASDKLDIVLVPSHYYGAAAGSNARWIQDAAAFEQRLFQHDFWKRFRDRVNVYRLDVSTTDDFSLVGAGWTPDQNRIKAFAQAEAPFLDFQQNDQILFIIESTGYQADPKRTPGIGVTRGDPNILSIETTGIGSLIHEFGHAFGNLGDEYPKMVDASWVSTYPNIATSHAGNRCGDIWDGLTDVVVLAPGTQIAGAHDSRIVGCHESQDPRSGGKLYKPTRSACVMDQVGDTFPFCPVCQQHLVKLLDRYTTTRKCNLQDGTFRSRADLEKVTGSLTTVNFDSTPAQVPIAAPSPGVLLGDQYSAVGVEFTAGVVFGGLPFSGVSKPNAVSNTGVNEKERSLVAGYFPNPVCAVGITNTGAQGVLRLYDEGYRLIGSIRADTNPATSDFLGVTSSKPVHRFEFDFESGIGFGGDDLVFGVRPTS